MIIFQIFAGSWTTSFYMFYHDNIVLNFYLIFQTAFTVIMIILTNLPKFKGSNQFKIKYFLLAGYGLSNVVPVYHFIQKSYSNNDMSLHIRDISAMKYLLYEFISYFLGMLFLVFHLPERLIPKKFDVWMNSHSIWHIFVLFGIWFQGECLMMLFHQRLKIL